MARARFGRRLGEDARRGLAAGLTPSPGSLGLGIPASAFPSSPVREMLHAAMGLVTVRVHPRSRRTAVELGERGILARVRAAPEAGRANEEARLALADALGVPGSSVVLRRGARSRTKVFAVEGVDQAAAEMRLRATDLG